MIWWDCSLKASKDAKLQMKLFSGPELTGTIAWSFVFGCIFKRHWLLDHSGKKGKAPAKPAKLALNLLILVLVLVARVKGCIRDSQQKQHSLSKTMPPGPAPSAAWIVIGAETRSCLLIGWSVSEAGRFVTTGQQQRKTSKCFPLIKSQWVSLNTIITAVSLRWRAGT